MADHEHKFITSHKYKNYEFCFLCDSYHSTALMDAKELYENDYWDEKNGHSYWGDQIGNLTQFKYDNYSKVDKVLSYVKKSGTLLEIGCAPGVVMRRAARKKCDVYGIEPDIKLIPEIIKVAQCDKNKIIHGYFPEVKLPLEKFDYIIAMDIVEHIEDYRTFIKSAFELLNENGLFIMMSPTIKNGEYRERDFCAHEHAWIFNHKYLMDYLNTMFKEIFYDRWVVGHEIYVCKKLKV